jgi:hypothetical protein
MAFDSRGLDDYVDVAARVVEFRTKHPEGSLQPANLDQPFTVVTIGDDTFVVVVAAAYRTPDDPRPGIGMAYEPYPGRTPYTKASELQNAETAAWGRAIVAALAADTKKGLASREEARNRQAEREPERGNGLITPAQMRHMQALYGDMKITDRGNKLAYAIDIIGRPVESSKELTTAEAGEVIASLQRWKEQDEGAVDEASGKDAAVTS